MAQISITELEKRIAFLESRINVLLKNARAINELDKINHLLGEEDMFAVFDQSIQDTVSVKTKHIKDYIIGQLAFASTDFDLFQVGTAYDRNHLVVHNGIVYRAKNIIPATYASYPDEDPANWELFIGERLSLARTLKGDLPGTPFPSPPLEGDYFNVTANGTYNGVSVLTGQQLVYHNGKWIAITPDTGLLEAKNFDLWSPGKVFEKDNIVLYQGILYKLRADLPPGQSTTPDGNPFYEVFVGHIPELAKTYLGEATTALNPPSRTYGDKGFVLHCKGRW